MIFSGWGGWVNQHPDHIVRNACLQELVSSPWPVVFPDGDVLIYNIGFWIIPALAGKLAGLDAARILLPLWGPGDSFWPGAGSASFPDAAPPSSPFC